MTSLDADDDAAQEPDSGSAIPLGRQTITIEEFAELAGIGRTTAYEAARRGEIPARRVGRRFVCPMPLVRQWFGEVGYSSDLAPVPRLSVQTDMTLADSEVGGRTRYRDLRARTDLDGPGVYLLIGPTESGLPSSRVYIGETDDLPGRLDNHNKNKDFWNRAIVFTSKDSNLNKAHIRYLEARLIGLAKAANRAELDNGTVGSFAPLSEPDTAEAEAFLAEMLLIYPVLGVQVFQKAEEQPSSSVRLHLAGKDTKAEGTETADGFVVYAGSLARAAEVPSIHAYGTQLRAALLEKGLFVEAGKHLRLTEDYVFASPSTAAMVMLGRTSNGRVEWKTSAGQTLKGLQTADTAAES